MIVLVAVTVATALLALTFVFRFDTWRIVAWPQTLLPALIAFALFMMVATLIAEMWLEAILFGLSLVVFIAQLPRTTQPIRDYDRQSRGPIKILHANVLYLNTDYKRVIETVLSHDADVVTICELDINWNQAIEEHTEFSRSYPARITAPADRADGIAIYSKFTITEHDIIPAVAKNAITATIEVPGDRPLRIITGHPMPPVNRAKTLDWRPSFLALRDLYRRHAQLDTPTVVIGDFNATHWHPSFRILSNELQYVRPARSRLIGTRTNT